jgi:parallel beta-helix repeat protein
MNTRITSVLCAAILACFTSTALAVDGVVLIDQKGATTGNITPGDEAGFPITISHSGSYRLTGNLTVPAHTNGIVIAANEVTIDLNGFRLTGGGEAHGITDERVARRTIVIRNGTISNFVVGAAIELSSHQVEIEQIRAFNTAFGIRIRGSKGAVLRGNNVYNNNVGLLVETQGAIVTGNTASDNNAAGIQVNGAFALVTGNSVFSNNAWGLSVGCPSNLVGNMAAQNGLGDIQTWGVGCTRTSNNPAP